MIGKVGVQTESAAQTVTFMRREEPVHALRALIGRTVPPLRERVQHRVREREAIGRVVDALDVAQKLPALAHGVAKVAQRRRHVEVIERLWRRCAVHPTSLSGP